VAARERCVGVPVSKRSRPVRETGRRTAVPGDGAYALSSIGPRTCLQGKQGEIPWIPKASPDLNHRSASCSTVSSRHELDG
jgi:hypothetical protein